MEMGSSFCILNMSKRSRPVELPARPVESSVLPMAVDLVAPPMNFEPDVSTTAPVASVAVTVSDDTTVIQPSSAPGAAVGSNREKFPKAIAVVENIHPPSPAGNRDRFRQSLMPLQVTCDLSSVSADPGMRFSFQGIVLVVYPASNNPSRRHVLLGDGRGIVGLTVWNTHVQAFSFSSVGQLAAFTKVSLTNNNGTRGLALSKESNISFSVSNEHFAQIWWNSIIKMPAVPAIHFHDCKENSIVNVAGILGNVASEHKNVRSDSKELLQLQLVDRTGIVMIRSWNHSSSLFAHLVDSPVLIQRVRVTSFAGMKIAEMFDGTGTVIQQGDFEGAQDLIKFWSE
jgi:hypothetical protein